MKIQYTCNEEKLGGKTAKKLFRRLIKPTFIKDPPRAFAKVK